MQEEGRGLIESHETGYVHFLWGGTLCTARYVTDTSFWRARPLQELTHSVQLPSENVRLLGCSKLRGEPRVSLARFCSAKRCGEGAMPLGL